MTKARDAALRWFAENEPVGWFDRRAPNARMRRLMELEGQIMALPTGAGFGLIRYRRTAAGIAATPPTQVGNTDAPIRGIVE